jgi:dipeptidyl-peptidase-4
MSGRSSTFVLRAISFALLFSSTPILPILPILRADGSRSDYERALSLSPRTEGKVFRDRVRPRWIGDGKLFWYEVETGPGTREFVQVDAVRGVRAPLFDAAKLAVALGASLGREVRADALPLERVDLVPGERKIRFRVDERSFRFDLDSAELIQVEDSESVVERLRPVRTERSSVSDEETYITFVNSTPAPVELFWVDGEGRRRSYGRVDPGGERRQHTFVGHVWVIVGDDGSELGETVGRDGSSRIVIDGTMDRDSEPETRRGSGRRGRGRGGAGRSGAGRSSNGRSPDGSSIAAIEDGNVVVRVVDSREEILRTTDGTADDAYTDDLVWSPDSGSLVAMQVAAGEKREVAFVESSPRDRLQPRLHTIDYAKPGDRIARRRPRLLDVAGRRVVPIAEDLFPNPWENSRVRWDADSRRFTFLYNERGHQVLRWIAVDAASGSARAIIEERQPTFVDYAHKLFLHVIEERRVAVWMSERDGWNHLYLVDIDTGEVRRQLTRGEWVVRGIERVDDEQRRIWFWAGGIVPGEDPYGVHLARVELDTGALVVVTRGEGNHSVEWSPDGRSIIDVWSRVDLPPVTELRDAEDGRLIVRLEEADASQLIAAGWTLPERFVAKGRDGSTDIHGIIVRPSRFDPNRRYPIIEEIYAGPHGAHVPRSFGRLIRQHQFAELGFIVVQIDGMGTSQRSKAFHDVAWRNLADAGFPDRKAWLRAAASTRPWMDSSRVGIFGGSAGGQNALRALIDHHDLYKVAVADCGCHDNRMDKIWWNELWLGWPIGEAYEASSNVLHAHRMEGKLLLIVGELDSNVDPASTMQVVDALEKADKDFDLLVMTGVGHGSAETPYASRRRMDFFVRHLLGVEPRHSETSAD